MKRRFGLTAVIAVAAVLATAPATAATAAAAAPQVDVMAVGKLTTLVPSTTVTAKSARVRVAHRRCTVPAATPLAALLAAAKRAKQKVKLRDYGSCSKRSADAGQLFVRSIGRDRNRASNGWVYKVGNRAGTTGAADPSGPFGSGRIKGGEQILWFWCHNRGGGACQKTVQQQVTLVAGGEGHRILVSVSYQDNDGNSQPGADAVVNAGVLTARPGPSGQSQFDLPGPGQYTITSCREHLVCSFPTTVTVP